VNTPPSTQTTTQDIDLHDGAAHVHVEPEYGYLDMEIDLPAAAFAEARQIIDAWGWQLIDPEDNPPCHLPTGGLRWWLEPKEIPSE